MLAHIDTSKTIATRSTYYCVGKKTQGIKERDKGNGAHHEIITDQQM